MSSQRTKCVALNKAVSKLDQLSRRKGAVLIRCSLAVQRMAALLWTTSTSFHSSASERKLKTDTFIWVPNLLSMTMYAHTTRVAKPPVVSVLILHAWWQLMTWLLETDTHTLTHTHEHAKCRSRIWAWGVKWFAYGLCKYFPFWSYIPLYFTEIDQEALQCLSQQGKWHLLLMLTCRLRKAQTKKW